MLDTTTLVDGRLPVAIALARDNRGFTVLHVIADFLRSRMRAGEWQFGAVNVIPMHFLLAIPGLEALVDALPSADPTLADRSVYGLLANQTKAGWCLHAQNDVCRWLLAHRADPNLPGGVPLKLAIGCGNVAMVEHLLIAGADPILAERLFRNARGAEEHLPLAEYVLAAGAADSGSTMRMLTLLDDHGWTVCRIVRVERKTK